MKHYAEKITALQTAIEVEKTLVTEGKRLKKETRDVTGYLCSLAIADQGAGVDGMRNEIM